MNLIKGDQNKCHAYTVQNKKVSCIYFDNDKPCLCISKAKQVWSVDSCSLLI
jgi:hypothetical protein